MKKRFENHMELLLVENKDKSHMFISNTLMEHQHTEKTFLYEIFTMFYQQRNIHKLS